MRILVVSWWWPYPADNGAKLRIYNLLKVLSQQHHVTLLSFAQEGEATPEHIAHMEIFCADVDVVPRPTYRPKSIKAQMGFFSKWPRHLVDVYSEDMAVRVQHVAHHERAEVLVACELQSMRYLEVEPHVPRVLEEIEIQGFHDAVANARTPVHRARAKLTLDKMQNALRKLMEQGVLLTVVSEKERTLFQKIKPDARIEVIPNGVDTQILTYKSDGYTPFSLIYNGAVTYSANEDAVRYFARDVLPLIRQKFPETTFSITGKTSSVDVSDLQAQPGVNFTGYLDDIGAAVRASHAVVVSLRQGGGTRLKILEAMALGTPVISTRKGAEGIDAKDGEHLLLADTSTELAAAVTRLFMEDGLRTRLALQARALVESQYDWQVIGARLSQVLEAAKQSYTPR